MNLPSTYDLVIGTGGIGTGIFLALEGDHTLGREESRLAELLDQRDYCKLHIVCHYVKRLLGDDFPVVPIGKVGADEAGRSVLEEMRSTGLDLTYVGTSTRPTLFAVCFLYPNGDGGNLSTSRSASAAVSAEDVYLARPVLQRHCGRGIAVALPEVPLSARAALLQLATEHEFLRVATLVPGEVEEALALGLLRSVDLLCVNIDEAAALGGVAVETAATSEVVEAAVRRLSQMHPQMSVVLTAGRQGSWAWDGRSLTHAPAVAVEPVSSAGAGDAHLAGLVVATVRGLDLASANLFAGLVSGLKVTSRHTINHDIDPASVVAASEQHARPLPPALLELFT